MVMLIYHYDDIIEELLITPIISYNIYDHQKHYLGEPVNIHI